MILIRIKDLLYLFVVVVEMFCLWIYRCELETENSRYSIVFVRISILDALVSLS